MTNDKEFEVYELIEQGIMVPIYNINKGPLTYEQLKKFLKQLNKPKEKVMPIARVPIIKSELKRMFDAGRTRQEMATHYGLSLIQMNKAIKAAGFSGARTKKVSFDIIDDMTMSPIVTASSIPLSTTLTQLTQETESEISDTAF